MTRSAMSRTVARFVRIDDIPGGVPERWAATGWLPGRGELVHLRPKSFAHPLALVLGGCAEHPRHHPARRGGQVDGAGGDGVHGGAFRFDDGDEALEVGGTSVETVCVVGDDGVDRTLLDELDEALELRALACLVGAGVVVDEHHDHVEAGTLGELSAESLLTIDAESVVVLVLADAGVDRCGHGPRGVEHHVVRYPYGTLAFRIRHTPAQLAPGSGPRRFGERPRVSHEPAYLRGECPVSPHPAPLPLRPMPPQTPNFTPMRRAYSRHSPRTGHARQMALASFVEAPRSGKNTEPGRSPHAAIVLPTLAAG